MPPDLTRGRRDVFLGFRPGPTVHPGLWLGRFLGLQTWHHDRHPDNYVKEVAQRARDQLIQQVEDLPLPEGYVQAFEGWRAGFDPERTAFASARARGRVIVGLGAKGATEIGISLHHTWGVPILPGSSLKGIASLGARRWLEDWEGRANPAEARVGGPTAFDALFGDVEEQGAVLFHDAWPILDRSGRIPLHRDVITVHHPGYYQRDGEPSDTESPIPVPFVSASGSWLLALELAPGLDPGSHGGWLEAAWTALRLGLDRHGIGAKTNAGYGRIEVTGWAETSAGRTQADRRLKAGERDAEARRRAERERLQSRREALATPEDRAADVGAAPGGWDQLRQWILTGGAAEVVGLPPDRAHVVAAVRALFAAQKASGLQASAPEPWRPWVAEGLAPPPAALAARRGAQPGEIDQILQRYTRKQAVDFRKAVAALVRARLDERGLEAAEARLRELGAANGHLRDLLADLTLARSGG